jgi:hypothetical protein
MMMIEVKPYEIIKKNKLTEIPGSHGGENVDCRLLGEVICSSETLVITYKIAYLH